MSMPYEGISTTSGIPGISGSNTGGDGVVGVGHRGVVGQSDHYQGVFGGSTDNAGVVGEILRIAGRVRATSRRSCAGSANRVRRCGGAGRRATNEAGPAGVERRWHRGARGRSACVERDDARRVVTGHALLRAEHDCRATYGIIAVSPDGREIVYAATVGTTKMFFRRVIDQFEAKPIAGTEGAVQPLGTRPAGRSAEWRRQPQRGRCGVRVAQRRARPLLAGCGL
jgi:hypothetical protein